MKIWGRERSSSNPQSVAYAGISVDRGGLIYKFGIRNGSYKNHGARVSLLSPILKAINHAAHDEKTRVVAAGIVDHDGDGPKIGSQLWMGSGAVPHYLPVSYGGDTAAITRAIESQYTPDGIAKVQYGENREIIPSRLVTLDYYQRANPQAIAEARFFAEKLKELGNDSIAHISSTPQGGGVAIMRHAEMRLAREMGLNMHWHVMEPDNDAFEVTKRKIHNILQNVAPDETELTDNDKKIYQAWIAKNAELLKPVFESSKVLIIDDPQPSGLIPYALAANPNLVILYRSHIEIINEFTDNPDTPQHRVWDYLWNGDPKFGTENNGIKAAKAFITHPMSSFVPTDVPRERVFGMAPTTDRFDGLNKDLSQDEIAMYLGQVNDLLEHPKIPGQRPQTAIDLSRPYVSQRARLDPSKGYPDLMDAFKITWDKINDERSKKKTKAPLPQLVMIANTAADDPDAQMVFEQLQAKLDTPEFSYMAHDIKIVRAPHDDLLLNAVTRASRFVTQLSLREGFEFNVEEAIMKRKPVIGSERGGIPLQIEQGAGYKVDPRGQKQFAPEAIQEVAQHMYDLFTNDKLYARMSRKAAESAHDDYKTEQNVANWQWLAYNAVLQAQNKPEGKDGNFGTTPGVGYVPDMVREAFFAQNGRVDRRRHLRFPIPAFLSPAA